MYYDFRAQTEQRPRVTVTPDRAGRLRLWCISRGGVWQSYAPLCPSGPPCNHYGPLWDADQQSLVLPSTVWAVARCQEEVDVLIGKPAQRLRDARAVAPRCFRDNVLQAILLARNSSPLGLAWAEDAGEWLMDETSTGRVLQTPDGPRTPVFDAITIFVATHRVPPAQVHGSGG